VRRPAFESRKPSSLGCSCGMPKASKASTVGFPRRWLLTRIRISRGLMPAATRSRHDSAIASPSRLEFAKLQRWAVPGTGGADVL
jgi:hypothetical protein